MRAGSLRHRILIKSPLDSADVTQDSYGADEGEPATVGTFACRVETLLGAERATAQQIWATAKYKITMRHQPGITFTRKMFGIWNARRLNFLDVQDPGDLMRPEVVFFAEEVEGNPVE